MWEIQLLHPKLVHFTVALLITAAFCEGLRLVTRRDIFGEVARWNCIFGGLAAIVTFISGNLAEGHVIIAGGAREVFETHETFGYITLILAILVMIRQVTPVPLRRKLQSIYLVLLAAVVISISVGAYNGGRLVYDFGVGVKTAAPADTGTAGDSKSP